MAIKLRLTGVVSDAPRSLTFTPSGTPRFSFCVRVGGLRKRTYRITAYGTQARFGDAHLHMGDRVQIDGAYLRRAPAVEALVRADTIRHIGRLAPPPEPIDVTWPTRPPIADAAADVAPMTAELRAARASEAAVDDALATV